MGIDLWLKTRFLTQRPLIFKVNVLNFKAIEVKRFAEKKSGFPVHPAPGCHLKFSNSSPGHNLKANDMKFGSNTQLSKLLLKA